MPLVANTWLSTVVQEHNGQEMANVICLRSDTFFSTSVVALAIANAWTQPDSFADCQTQDILYKRVEVRGLEPVSETVVHQWSAFAVTDNGNVVGDPIDPGSCLGFSLRTGLPGKSRRGRLFLGGVGRGGLNGFSTQWDFGTSPGTIFAGAAESFRQALLAGVGSFAWAVYSRKLVEANNITTILARDSILSQNQRARRYGTV